MPLPQLLGPALLAALLTPYPVHAQDWTVRVLAQRDLHVPNEVHAGDLDGDGDIDVVTSGAFERPFVQIYENLGNGMAWQLRTPIDSLPFQTWVVYSALGDMDQDGDLDLLVGPRVDSQTNGWFRNDGAWQFTWTPAMSVLPSGTLGRDARVLDMDGDEWPDLLMRRTDGATVVLGAGSPGGPAAQMVVNDRPLFDMAVLDIDLDGDPDMVARETYSQGGWIHNLMVSRQSADHTFAPWTLLWPDPHTGPIHTADMDQDGATDLLMSPLGWHRNTGDALAPLTTLDLGGAERFMPVDVDGDGDPDLLTFTGDEARLWTNDGTGNFAPASTLPVGVRDADAVNEAISDLNADGMPDIVGVRSPGVLGWAPVAQQGSAYFTEISRSFDQVKGLAIGDADMDGTPDLLFASTSRAGWFDVVGSTDIVPPNTLSLLTGASELPMDLDGDGDLDAHAVTGSGSWALLNDGTGHLVPQPNTGASVLGSARRNYMDVDNNGSMDVVRATTTDLVLQHGPATAWGAPVVLDAFVSNPPHVALSGHFNSDIWPDLIAFSPGNSCDPNSNGHVFLGTGNGNFAPVTCPSGLFGFVPSDRIIYLEDMDGDGDTDILNASFIDLSWSANDGNGQFGPMQELLPDIRVVSGCLVDLNGDGLRDLCYYSEIGIHGEGVFISYQAPGPAFSPPQLISTIACEHLLAMDIDADGDEDVVAARSTAPFWYQVIAFVNDFTTGARAYVEAPRLQVVPVPMRSTAIIAAPTGLGDGASLELLDMQGRSIGIWDIPSAGRSVLERNGLPAGAYILRVIGTEVPVAPVRVVME